MRGKCDKNVANTLPRVIGNCGVLKDNLLLHGICTVAFSQNLNYRRRKKNTFSKLFLRKPVFTVVLTLLLTFAVGFSCIGFSAYATAYEQRIMIEKDYTSIALPAPKRVLQYKTEDGAVMYYEDDTFAYDFDRIEAVAKNAPQYKRSSNSGFLGGALTDMCGVAGGMWRTGRLPFQLIEFDRYGCAFRVLALECIGVDDRSAKPDADQVFGIFKKGYMAYSAYFRVIGTPSIMEQYGDITGNYVCIGETWYDGPYNDDLTVQYEVGKRYVVRGFIDSVMNVNINPNYMSIIGKNYCLGFNLWQTNSYEVKMPDLYPEKRQREDGVYYIVTCAGSLPYFAEYDGDWRDFLNSDAGAVWRENIIPWTSMNQSAVSVVLTDNIYDSFNFNAGKALVMEGRAFSEREYANGDDVCLVSAAFADINGVTVGDTVEIDYYDCGISENHFLSNIDKVQIRRTMMPSERIGLKKKYTVVGIYTSPEFSDGSYNFTADTVFVPKKSVPDAEKYEKHDVPYLNSIVIKNGQLGEFEKYMEEQGLGGYHLYYEMGYKDAEPTVTALVANATRVIAIAMSLLVLVAAVGIYLTFMRMKPVIRSERLVGVKRGTVWCGISGVFSAVIGISVALGALLGALLYGNITKAIFETSVELNLPALIACTAGEFVLLTAAAMLAAVPAASPNLMNSGRVKRKK